MGLSIEDLLELPQRELDRWQRYWAEEPWGAYRDNLHAAMIVQYGLAPHLGPKAKPVRLDDFMFQHPEDRRERNRLEAARTFSTMARQGRAKGES